MGDWYQLQFVRNSDGKVTQLNFEYDDEDSAREFFDSNQFIDYISNSIIGGSNGTLMIKNWGTGEIIATS